MLDLHIGTKAVDVVFHKESEAFYDMLFDIFHQVSEKNQDLEIDEPTDCESAKLEAYSLLEEAKSELEGMIKSNKDMGMDNLLRDLLDKLQFQIGTARGFYNHVKEEETPEEDMSEPMEETPTKKQLFNLK